MTSRWTGPLLAVIGVFGFSVKAILVKLAYAWYPLDAVTLLTMRMLYAAPFFLAMAWWASRRPGTRRPSRADWKSIMLLGFIGYYLSSLLDFMGLAYISAGLERLVLYLHPTMVVLLSALLLRKPITGVMVAALLLSYAGIALVFLHDLRVAGSPAAIWTGGTLVFIGAALYALYLVLAGGVIGRIGSLRFISYAMLASTVFIVLQFVLTRDLDLLRLPVAINLLALAMAVFCTVLPTWLIAEAIHRIGANASSLVGSLGPVFTIGLGALMLGESVHWIQLVGTALVLAGVTLTTLRPDSGGPGAAITNRAGASSGS